MATVTPGGEVDPRPLAWRVGALTGILVPLCLATQAAFALHSGARYSLCVFSVMAVFALGPKLLVSGIKLAQIDSEWRALGVAGVVVGALATTATVLAAVAFFVVIATCSSNACSFV